MNPPITTAVPSAGPYVLGARSKAELEGVHPRLIEAVRRAIQLTAQDFTVHDGLRGATEQRVYVATGVSVTLDSLHLRQADGFGHAVDLVPWINGKLRWEWPPIYVIASAMHEVATAMALPLVWGGVWDRPFLSLPGDPKGLEAAVVAYVARRKKARPGKPVFIDGPHYQLS